MIARYSGAFSEPTYRKTIIGSGDGLTALLDVTSVLIGEIYLKWDFGIDTSRPVLGHRRNELPPFHCRAYRIIEKGAAAAQFGADDISSLADAGLDRNAHRSDFQHCLHFGRELRFDAGLQPG